MDQREAFLSEQQRGLHTMLELCVRYAITRTTGYAWVARVAEAGRAGLQVRAAESVNHTQPLARYR